MALKTNRPDNLTSVEFSMNDLVYTPEGEALLERSKIRKAVKLFDLADAQNRENAIVSDGDYTVTAKGHLGPEKWKDAEAFYYKFDIPENSFFVKRIPAALNYETGGGTGELYDTQEAKNLLAGLENVEIVDYVLGYDGTKYKYFVSKWNPNFESTLAYLEDIKEKGKQPTEQELKLLERIKNIQKILGIKYWDTNPHNMSYDPRTGKIYLFDLNKAKELP